MNKKYYIEAVCIKCSKSRLISKYSYRDLCMTCACEDRNSSLEWRENHSEKMKGKPSPMKNKIFTKEHRENISNANLGKSIPEGIGYQKGSIPKNKKLFCEPIIVAMYSIGMSTSEISVIYDCHKTTINNVLKRNNVTLRDSKELLIEASRLRSGDKSPNWQGGITNVGQMIRKTQTYKVIRQEVLVRDNYKCILCESDINICVDHIKSFSDYPELRLDKDNLRVLCKKCHINTDNYGNKGRKWSKKINNTITI